MRTKRTLVSLAVSAARWALSRSLLRQSLSLFGEELELLVESMIHIMGFPSSGFCPIDFEAKL